jgi:p-hydroxybenzoate 3-monooxygenase
LLSHLLHLEGIRSVVVESRSRQYVEERVRAGVLEQGSVDLLIAAGVGERMLREGLRHEGIELLFEGQRHRIDFLDLVGRCVTVYGQQEVVKDLIAARLAADPESIIFDSGAVNLSGFGAADIAEIRCGIKGEEILRCDFIAGCDGFHGISRESIPATEIRTYDRSYPFAWLGVLAQARPASHELIYANHDRGFALMSMRSPSITRLYLECDPDEDLNGWPDARIWEELQIRLASTAFRLEEGPILQKGVTPMRSFVAEPMQFGRMFLAGDAAHIVPPTGAKGMNLAMADVRVLSLAMREYYQSGSEVALQSYSRTCLRRVWRAQQFSWWMTSMMHRGAVGASFAFDRKRQLAELDHVTSSRFAAANLAENYTGLPLH